MKHWIRGAVLLLPLLVLSACLFQPGKFESSLTLHKDRSFTFTYRGEVVAIDLEGMSKGMGTPGSGDSDADDDGMANATAEDAETPEEKAAAKAAKDEEYRQVAAQLAKEEGYRTVEYRGDGVFYVDYSISGVLTHNFVYPYNQDSAMIFPWVTVELRAGGTARVKAPGFAKQDTSGMGAMGMGSGGDMPSKLDGTFTLITDAELVSQNNEEGAKTAGVNSVIAWRVNARTDDAPMAVLRLAPR